MRCYDTPTKVTLHKTLIRILTQTAFLTLAALILAVTGGSTRAQEAPNPKAPPSERHEFVIPNFKTESGVTLPQAKIVYGTYGHLNAAKDNVILMPSHYMADYHGYEWLIGEKLALDPANLFLVTTEMFGSGHSSSPSNTPEPFHGPRFPVTTIRDNVEAVHHLLVDELKVTHLRAIIGFSMGARAGLPVGRQLSSFHGSHRRDGRYRKVLPARLHSPRKPNQRHRPRSSLQQRRLHERAHERHRSLRA